MKFYGIQKANLTPRRGSRATPMAVNGTLVHQYLSPTCFLYARKVKP